MKNSDIEEAYLLLAKMNDALDGMIDMTQQMAAAAARCDAPGLSFAAQMMAESTQSFREEMTRFVVERAIP